MTIGTPRRGTEERLGVGIEVRAIRVLEWMEDDCASLVVCDCDGARRVAAPMVGPANIACEHVLRSLQPLEADHGVNRLAKIARRITITAAAPTSG